MERESLTIKEAGLLERVIKKANRQYGGHLFITKWTTGWKGCFNELKFHLDVYDQILEMEIYPTFETLLKSLLDGRRGTEI